MDAWVPEVIGVDAVGALVWAKMAQEENPRKNAATMEEVVFTTSLYQEANIVSIDAADRPSNAGNRAGDSYRSTDPCVAGNCNLTVRGRVDEAATGGSSGRLGVGCPRNHQQRNSSRLDIPTMHPPL